MSFKSILFVIGLLCFGFFGIAAGQNLYFGGRDDYPVGIHPNSLHGIDIENDGDIDLVTCEHKGNDFRLMLFQNDGKGNFTMHLADKGHESHLGTQLADLDSDGDLDIVSIAWDNYKFLHVWRNDAIKTEIK